jgi:hypothetical protein
MIRPDQYIVSVITVLCLFPVSLQLKSQEKIQVASLTVIREYGSDITSVMLTAEKSDIFLYPSKNEKIRIEIKLISKNPDQKTAVNDLEAIFYEIKENTGTIALKNYFQPPNEKPIKSNLSVRYSIYLPAPVSTRINCLYSKIKVLETHSECNIIAGFSDITLNNCHSHVTLRSHYCGIKIDEGNAVLSGSLDKSDMSLNDCSGSVDMNTNYGRVNITQQRACAGIRFIGYYTEFVLTAPEEQLKNCRFSTISGSIDVPDEYISRVREKKNKTTLTIINDAAYFPINISTTYNIIRLHETKK